MANRWCDGLGRYGGDKTKMLNGSSSQAWAQVDSSGITLSAANPRTGTHCLRFSGAAGRHEARRVFGDQLGEVLTGYAIYCHSLPSIETYGTTDGGLGGIYIAELRDQANSRQLRFMLGTDGAIEVRRDTVVLGRTVPIIGAGSYQHIEIYAKAGNSDGAVEIRVDEVTRLNLTGKDTVATSNVEFSQLALGYELRAGGDPAAPTIDFADFYCNDTVDDGSGCNTFIGDCKSGVRMVSADTAQADFTLSSGATGYSLLNETPPDDADYITTEDTTAESDFEIAGGPINLTEILTARPFVRAWKDDAGTCELAPSLISNGDKAVVTAQPIATAASYYDNNVPLDPDTGAPWEPAALAAALEAIERTA